MQLTGAEIVIECLKEQGVDTVFGYPGGTILNIYDELYKHSNEIHHVLTSHEQGAEMCIRDRCVLHNLYFYNTMMTEIRQALDEGHYEDYKQQKLERMAAGPKA